MKRIILAKPRGFCAGVERAVEIVEKSLAIYGAPLYVKHEIVHNKFVVQGFKERGVVFLDNIENIPNNSIVIFSAHGVSLKVVKKAKEKKLKIIDATCPLVTKVHLQVQRHSKNKRVIVLIGHKNHPETIGTVGRIDDKVHIVATTQDVLSLPLSSDEPISYSTQTTLSIDDTKEIITALKQRFTDIEGPEIQNICYATQNRQSAVKMLAANVDNILVIGSKNSSNSNRLRDIGETYGTKSYLIDGIDDIDLNIIAGESLGITAGASAPEFIVKEVIEFLFKHFPNAVLSEMNGARENIKFKLPNELMTFKTSPQTSHQ